MEAPIECVTSERLGKATRLDDARGRYIEFCKSTFPNEMDLRGLRIVVDCANGAAYHIAPDVFHELGAEVIAIGNQPNGTNINDQVGATSPETLARTVKSHGANLGIALDGDADRLIMVDDTGRIYNGDELLYVMVRDRAAVGPVAGVVGTLMTNMALEVALRKMDIEFARAKVGDRYVLEVLQEKGWLLGGEGSGHLLALDRHTTGDGIISALQILCALKRSGKTLAQCAEDLKLFPQSLVNVKVTPGFNWQKNTDLINEKEEIEAILGDDGRVLIRASGTEPLIRVMVEARTSEVADKMAHRLADKLKLAA
jgi:phosphoglucosamine mutase